MNRVFLIARREYLAYVKTVGFWLSMAMVPLVLAVTSLAPIVMMRSSPTPTVAVVDLTTHGFTGEIGKGLARTEGGPMARGGVLVAAPGAPFASAAAATAALRPYVAGEKTLTDGRRIDVAAIITETGGQVGIDVWSRNIANRDAEQRIRGAVTRVLRDEALRRAGVAPETLSSIDGLAPTVTAYSPKAAAGRVSFRDRLPGIVGFGMAIALWSVVMTGAGILLNSVIEEKSSRILEVLLSSASASEIMIGKIAGVALVTTTVMGVWASIGGGLALALQPGLAADLGAVLMAKGLIFYFLFYFIAGYLMFATLFTTVGAFCETTREAQTLLGPMMMFLIVPMIFLSQAITQPDAPLLRVLSWIPPFTPFMMAARAASEPPLWEIIGTTVLLIATIYGEFWLAGRAFKAGALSNTRFDVKRFFASLIGRAPV